jgi:hypothetical protein
LLLQIHDFAEDGRPEAYSREAYPKDCHYAVINARDARILVSAGLKPAGVHLVPNAIKALPVDSDGTLESCVAYPVRAIRRKNIGEAILLSLYLPVGRKLHFSQPPTSPRDMAVYRGWQSFVKKRSLNVRFETGRRYGFAALVAAAETMVTTSITEGFGFSFLEPWTAGKMLWGRRLGDICSDFEKRGLCLEALYDSLAVPLTWFDYGGFIRAWHAAVLQAGERYGHGPAPDRLSNQIEAIQKEGLIDFGMLSETFQQQVLEHLLSDSKAKDWLAGQNPKIIEPDPSEGDSAILENNRQIVRGDYNLVSYGERLRKVYVQVIQQPVQHQIDKSILLDVLLDVSRFSLLKWGTHAA